MKKILIFNKVKDARKVFLLLCLLFVIFIFGSCATTMTQSQIVSPDYVPNEEIGYIYGRFYLLTIDEGYAIGLVVQNLDNSQKYNFILNTNSENSVQLAAVPQGNYRVDLIEYIKPKNKVAAVLDFSLPPEQYQRNFVVELNTAIYIGDYSGVAENSPETREIFWSLQVPINNFDETTVAIKEKYPLLTEPPISFVSNMEESSTANAINDNTIISAFFLAVTNNYLDVVKQFLAEGGNVDIQDSEGWTGLMHAAKNGHAEMFLALIEAGADITIKNNNGDTAFILADGNTAILNIPEVIEAVE